MYCPTEHGAVKPVQHTETMTRDRSRSIAHAGNRATPGSSPNPGAARYPGVLKLQHLVGNRAIAGWLGASRSAFWSAVRLPRSSSSPDLCIQRQQTTTTEHRAFVEELIIFFEEASGFYAEKERLRTGIPDLLPPPSPEATLREIARILPAWKRAYDGGRQIIAGSLSNDAGLATRLQAGYQRALEAIHRTARAAPRVNIILVAAPGRDDDEFLRNASAYARTYFTQPPRGDTIAVIEGVASLQELFAAVESAQPERMVRRVDIFAHGTIEPSNQLKLAGRWHSAEQLEAALAARQLTSEYLQSMSRFDANSAIEFHGCRLGGGEGERFLGAAGRALAGAHGQEMVGYRERWFPRRYQLNWRGHPVANTAQDIYGDNPLPMRKGRASTRLRVADGRRFIRDFEARAVRLFDNVVNGSLEAQVFMSPQERAAGQLTRERKVQIMRAMYDTNGAWLLGFLHPGRKVPDIDPAQALPRKDYTFTREHDAWQHRTLRLRVNP